MRQGSPSKPRDRLLVLSSWWCLSAASPFLPSLPCSCHDNVAAPNFTASAQSTCKAVGDPHYENWYGQKYSFYGRGLFEHARFTIASCGCEVVVQTMLVKLLRGYPANSGIAAIAVRAGDITFAVTGGGDVVVSGGGYEGHQIAPTPEEWSGNFGGTKLQRVRFKRWVWRLEFPGQGGWLVIYPKASSNMPGGFMYAAWLTVQLEEVTGQSGLCAVTCPKKHIPVLPFSAYCAGPLPRPDVCYPVQNSLFNSSELTWLNEQSNLPTSVRECEPAPPASPAIPPQPPSHPPPSEPLVECPSFYSSFWDEGQGVPLLPKEKNWKFQRKSWLTGCGYAEFESNGSIADCKSGCTNTNGCCNDAQSYASCSAKGCSGGNCCAASRQICEAACDAYFSPPPSQLPPLPCDTVYQHAACPWGGGSSGWGSNPKTRCMSPNVTGGQQAKIACCFDNAVGSLRTCQPGPCSGGNQRNVQLQEAIDECSAQGGRLCTRSELQLEFKGQQRVGPCCGAGCGLNSARVWTADSCCTEQPSPTMPPLPALLAPPASPPAAACDGSLIKGTWYSAPQAANSTLGVHWGEYGQELEGCTVWCTNELTHACSVRAAILLGEMVRCGYELADGGGEGGRCALFHAPNLSKFAIANASPLLYAASVDCAMKLPESITLCDDVCVANNVSEMQALDCCSKVEADPFFKEACVYDYCATEDDDCSMYEDSFEIDPGAMNATIASPAPAFPPSHPQEPSQSPQSLPSPVPRPPSPAPAFPPSHPQEPSQSPQSLPSPVPRPPSPPPPPSSSPDPSPPPPPSPPPSSSPASLPSSSPSCEASPGPLQLCGSTGDPHIRPWSGLKYDYQALGVYELARTTTVCGLTVEVQVFMCGRGRKYPGASSNAALALRAGSHTFVLESNLKLKMSAGTTSELLSVNRRKGAAVQHTHGGVSIAQVTTRTARTRVYGWQFKIPGGVIVKAYEWPKVPELPHGALLNVWVKFPSTGIDNSSGLCSGRCSGLPNLPSKSCSDSYCLPVFSESSLFPTLLLSSLEAKCGLDAGSSTRGNLADCDSLRRLPNSTDVSNPSPPTAPSLPTAACERIEASQQGKWWDPEPAYVAWGLAGTQARGECESWCSDRASTDCLLKAAVITGMQLHCGWRSASNANGPGTCAVAVGVDITVVTSIRPPDEKPSLDFVAPSSCAVDLPNVEPCSEIINPCYFSGYNHTEAQAACSDVDSGYFDECVYDVCAFADTSFAEMTEITYKIEECITATGCDDTLLPPSSPPSLPPSFPPSLPPFDPKSCVRDLGLEPMSGKDMGRCWKRDKKDGGDKWKLENKGNHLCDTYAEPVDPRRPGLGYWRCKVDFSTKPDRCVRDKAVGIMCARPGLESIEQSQLIDGDELPIGLIAGIGGGVFAVGLLALGIYCKRNLNKPVCTDEGGVRITSHIDISVSSPEGEKNQKESQTESQPG